MRGGHAAVGLLLVGIGFGMFAWILLGFGVANGPLFAVASAAALGAALALHLRRDAWAALGAGIVGTVFLWLQVTRPAFTLTLGSAGNLLIAAGAWIAAYGLLRPSHVRVAPAGWTVAAVGGLAFLPGNLEAGGSFLVAGIVATSGFALAGAPLVTSSATSPEPAPE